MRKAIEALIQDLRARAKSFESELNGPQPDWPDELGWDEGLKTDYYAQVFAIGEVSGKANAYVEVVDRLSKLLRNV